MHIQNDTSSYLAWSRIGQNGQTMTMKGRMSQKGLPGHGEFNTFKHSTTTGAGGFSSLSSPPPRFTFQKKSCVPSVPRLHTASQAPLPPLCHSFSLTLTERLLPLPLSALLSLISLYCKLWFSVLT